MVGWFGNTLKKLAATIIKMKWLTAEMM